MRALTAPSEAFFRRSGALRPGHGTDGEREVSVAGEVAVPSGALYLGPADGENGRDGVVVRVPAGRYRVLVTVAAGDSVRPPRVRAVSVELTPGPEAARSGLPANAFWHDSPGEVPVLEPGDGLFLVADAGLRDQHRDGAYPWTGWLADVVAPSLQDARVTGAHSTAIGFPGRDEALVALVFDRADDGSPLETAMFAGFDASGLPATLHVADVAEIEERSAPGHVAHAEASETWSPETQAPWSSADGTRRSSGDRSDAGEPERIDVPAFASPSDDAGSLDDLPWSSEHDDRSAQSRSSEAPSTDAWRSASAAGPGRVDDGSSDGRSSGAPAFGGSSSDARSFDAPTFGAPSYDAPSFQAPSQDASPFDAPSHEAPAFGGPSGDAPSFDAPSHEAPSADRQGPAEATGAAAFEPPSFDVPLGPPPAAAAGPGPAEWDQPGAGATTDGTGRTGGDQAAEGPPSAPFWASAAQRRRGDDPQSSAASGSRASATGSSGTGSSGTGAFGAVVGGAAAPQDPARTAQPAPPAPRADTGAVGSFFADDDVPAWADPTRVEHRPVPSFDDVIGEGAGSAWGPGNGPGAPLWDAPAQRAPEPQSAFGPAATGPQPRAERPVPGSGSQPGVHVPVPPQHAPGGVPAAPTFGDPGRGDRAAHVEAAPADPFWSDAGLPVQAAPGGPAPVAPPPGRAADRRSAPDGAPAFGAPPAFASTPAYEAPPAYEASPAYEAPPADEASPAYEAPPAFDAGPPAASPPSEPDVRDDGAPQAPWAPQQHGAPATAAVPPTPPSVSDDLPFAPGGGQRQSEPDAPSTPPWAAAGADDRGDSDAAFPADHRARGHEAGAVPEATLPAEPDGEGAELVAALDEGLAAVDGGDVHGAVPRLGTVLVGLECGAGELPDVDAAMRRTELTPAQLVDLVVDLQLGAGQANDALESLRRALASPTLSGSPAESVHLRKRFGELQLRAGDEGSAAATLERAERDAAELVRAASGPEDAEYARDYRAHIRFLLADSALKLEDAARSVELADASMREFEELGLDRMPGRAAFLAATGRGALGDEAGRIAAIRDAERMFRRGNELDGLGTALGFLGEDDALRGDYRAAIATFIEARDVLERAGEYANAAIAAGNLSVCLQQIGEHAAAEDAAHEADRLSARADSA